MDEATGQHTRDQRWRHLPNPPTRNPQFAMAVSSIHRRPNQLGGVRNNSMPAVDAATRTSPTYRESCNVAELFVLQASASPDLVAVVEGEHTCTYGELLSAVEHLADYLVHRGVGPEVIVGCYMERSLASVVGVLAILRAGGAYLLLDAQQPPVRLRHMTQDANPLLVLTETNAPEVLDDIECVALQQILHQPRYPSARTSTVGPDVLAYIAFTSGSTGRPKGVLITNSALRNHAQWFSRQFALKPGDRIPLMASLVFDVVAEEIFPALISGCTLIVSRNLDDVHELGHEITARGYTVLNLPAPLWHRWVDHLHEHHQPLPRSVRLLVVGSDKILSATFLRWKAVVGADNAQWVAAYGTTESTITTACYFTAWQDDLSNEPVMPIGTAVAGAEIYVVDEAGAPAAPNQVGELCIAGPGLARGYHRLPEQTARQFCRLHHDGERGPRVYKTGDLAVRRADGVLVWKGRRDNQIKVNGLRIELNEIEEILLRCPAVREAVVVRAHSAGADGILVAYLVPDHGQLLDASAVAAYLHTRLPVLMTPARLEILPSLPIGATGKIDRKALETRAKRQQSQCR
ncbi:amino acid adenylation domain-containing protein [Nocardia sp. NPDC057668]|uniref:amino acid adenylation domain-containing protein n=1 Tax=Nocardia sp. NPDC057668 TaxID=3346202 RepID=UPI0036726BB1